MTPHNVLITETVFAELGSLIGEQVDGLEFRFVPRDDLTDAYLAWADTWIGFRAPASPNDSSIRWYHSAADGIDSFHPMFRDLRNTGSLLTNTVGTMPHRIAEYVVAAVLGHIRSLPMYGEQERRGEWIQQPVTTAMNSKVTVVGTGRIGREIAAKLAPFVGEVRGLSRSGKAVAGFDAVATLDSGSFLGDADVVVAILPMTPDTDRVLDADFFERLTGAIFVNVGRGKTVDEDALRAALDSGAVAHAILDVMASEPLDSDDWRWTDPRVTLTPHISGQTMLSDVVDEFVAAYQAIIAGRQPERAIDLAGWY